MFTVISFYTTKSPYEKEVKNLSKSLDDFNINHIIQAIEPRGTWEENAKYKPIFIKEMLQSTETPILWLDADAVVLKYPHIFDTITTDVALYYRTTGPCAVRFKGYELITATMYFNNTSRAEALVDMWLKEQDTTTESSLIEQRSLQHIIPTWQAQHKGTITYLPQSYCRIFDAPEDNTVIQQNQASRRFRREVGV